MKKLFFVFMAFLLTISIASAEPFRVFDSADLFSPEEEAALEEAILEYRLSTRTDFCILTTDDYLAYDDSWEFAWTFYNRAGIGVGAGKLGALLYIDMHQRVPAIYTYLGTDAFLSDNDVSAIFDLIHPDLVAVEYAAAAQKALQYAQNACDAYWSALIEP